MKRKREESRVTWKDRLQAFDFPKSCIEYYAERNQLDECLHDQYLLQVLMDARVPVPVFQYALQAGASYDALYLTQLEESLLEYAAKTSIPHFIVLAAEIGRPYLNDPIIGIYVMYIRKLAHVQGLNTEMFTNGLLAEMGVTGLCLPTVLPCDLTNKQSIAEWLRPYRERSMYLHMLMFVRMMLVHEGTLQAKDVESFIQSLI